MADYKELLRRAVEALPENNGAARRAVYEKARAALVGQLRAINPPLAARDITAHRLQLEDCIRQVEQEASEAVIAGMGQASHEPSSRPAPPPPPAFVEPKAKPAPRPEPERRVEPERRAEAERRVETPAAPQADPASIEAIIAAADLAAIEPQPVAGKASPANKIVPKVATAQDEPEPEPTRETPPPAPMRNGNGGKPVPSIVARAEAAKGRPASTVFAIPSDKPYDNGRRGPSFEPRREAVAIGGGQAAMRKSEPEAGYAEPENVAQAMSSVREVEVETTSSDPQGAIDRAIAALDREARAEKGEAGKTGDGIAIDGDDVTPITPRKKGFFSKGAAPEIAADAPMAFKADQADRGEKPGRAAKPARAEKPAKPAKPAKPPKRGRGERGAGVAEAAFPRAQQENERSGIGAVTIFLLIFAVLLAGAGGAGVWAWREGYVDLDAMFGRGPVVEEASTPEIQPGTPAPVLDAINDVASTPPVEPPAPEPSQERLASLPEVPSESPATPEPESPSAALALAPSPDADAASQDRLPVGDGAAEPGSGATAALPGAATGSQSLLLEAAETGQTGAVPFSGTVEWSQGTDETGAPTLVGSASIPARNLGVDVLIRRNSDPSLPASHLMEINFSVTDSFIGGSIAGLPGVLLKNEELVQGTPLVGASARVVGNSFLFALSATPEDTTANSALLTSRKWIDLALIYATGRRAIITLEKDAEAEQLFADVFETWSETASAE